MEASLQAGVVSAPLQVLLDKVAIFLQREVCKYRDAEKNLSKLRRTLLRIKAMVSVIEENPSNFSNSPSTETWEMWIEDVGELVYSAEDWLEGVLLDLPRDAVTGSARANQDRQAKNNYREIDKRAEELEDIVREMEGFYKSEFTKLRGSNAGFNYRPHGYSCGRSSLVDEGSVIGRQTEKNDIVALVNSLNTTHVSVIPIVGMGGIGKTTLAQLVYNTVEGYNLKMWVSVSIDFDIMRITKSIIESASNERCKLSCLDAVQVKLQNLIRGKKFLLVLDDYWSEEDKDWDDLSSPFGVGANGSKILLTTRSLMVSRIVGTVDPHCLNSLSDEDSWRLVKQRASPNGELKSGFEQIGIRIAEKCKGLPLAAKAVGSMLRFNVEPREWMNILNSELWGWHRHDNEVLSALALSYYDLPAHLKKCFSYCSIFPKSYNFEATDLVLLWMAEGFLVHPRGDVRLEDVGNDYFNHLHSRSFFQASGRNSHGRIMYKMHDLIHSLAQMISGRACLHLEDNQPNEGDTFFRNIRHCSVNFRTRIPSELNSFPWYEKLRTLIVISESDSLIKLPKDLFPLLKCLRVLHLSLRLDKLPHNIHTLKRLRYLDLSSNNFVSLPPRLTELSNLQILKLENCANLACLPQNMKEMVGLRHLYVDKILLDPMPPEFGKLINLQHLTAFVVGSTEEKGIGQLENMKLLRGCLCIANLQNVADKNKAEQAMLHEKPFLDRLELEWEGSEVTRHEAVLAGLEPHENLKELLLIKYGGCMLPGWFQSPTCKLSSIDLKSCTNCNILLTLAALEHLKSLVIEDMPDWQQVNQDFSGFQSLESLTLKNIPHLTSWGVFTGDSRFPRLRTLCIDDCPMLKNLPSLLGTEVLRCLVINRCPEILQFPDNRFPRSLEKLEISDCNIIKERCQRDGPDWDKIRSIQGKIVIDGQQIEVA